VHVPLTQVRPLAHALPHALQFASSDWRSTQVPLQSVWPAGQPHVLFEQTLPPVHALLHAPQFALSFVVLRQFGPHCMFGGWQVGVHVPDWQVVVGVLHALPQPPQSVLLVCGSTHWPLQNSRPVAQMSVHTPLLHVWSDAHALPHEPQFASSVSKSLHVPPQQSGVAPLHAAPHAPQLLLSVCVLTHMLLQSTCGSVQLTVPWQVPVLPVGVQVWPGWHAAPQLPQFPSSVVRLTHVLLQLTCGDVQTVVV
jgi:hypothetical protein